MMQGFLFRKAQLPHCFTSKSHVMREIGHTWQENHSYSDLHICDIPSFLNTFQLIQPVKTIRVAPSSASPNAVCSTVPSGIAVGELALAVWYWLSVGAQPSDPVQRVLFRAGLLPPPPMLAMGRKGGPRDTRPADPLTGRLVTPNKPSNTDQPKRTEGGENEAKV